jgi:hypothetical protein
LIGLLTAIPDGFRKEARPDRQEAYVDFHPPHDVDIPRASISKKGIAILKLRLARDIFE